VALELQVLLPEWVAWQWATRVFFATGARVVSTAGAIKAMVTAASPLPSSAIVGRVEARQLPGATTTGPCAKLEVDRHQHPQLHSDGDAWDGRNLQQVDRHIGVQRLQLHSNSSSSLPARMLTIAAVAVAIVVVAVLIAGMQLVAATTVVATVAVVVALLLSCRCSRLYCLSYRPYC